MGALLGEKPANSLLSSARIDTRLDETALRPRLLASVQPLPEPELETGNVPLYPSRSTTGTTDPDLVAVPVDPSALPGHDLFSDMRIALEVSRNPEADWYQQMRESAMASSVIEGRQLELATQEANELVERMLNTPLRSLVGEGRTNANNELLKAESLMEIGHYYEAASALRRGRRNRAAQPDSADRSGRTRFWRRESTTRLRTPWCRRSIASRSWRVSGWI
jgi:hypothetical protein